MSDSQNENPASTNPPQVAWPPLPKSTGGPAYFGSAFVSPTPAARWAIGFLIAYAAIDLITATGELIEMRHDTDFVIGITTAGLDLIQAVVSLACAVFFLIWVYRVCSNADAFGARGMPISPGWTVGWFFVPVMNLFRPYQGIRDAWRASEPGLDLRNDPESWRAASMTSLLGVWWAYWLFYNLGSMLFAILSLALSPGYAFRNSGGPVILDVLHAGLCLVAIRLVILFTARQEEAAARSTG